MPRVAVIGGRLHAVKYARELDVDVVLVHEPDKYEPEFADHCERIVHAPVTDAAAVLEALTPLHRDRPFDRVLCTTDLGTVPAAEVAAALGVPHTPVSAARTIKNKAEVRRILAEQGIDPVRARLVRSRTDAAEFAAELGRIVLKPVDGSGSADVHIVSGAHEAELAWKAMESAGYREAVAEEFLEGPLATVEAFSVDGRHLTLGLTDETINDHLVEVGITAPPRVIGPYEATLRDLTVRLLDAIGVTDGPSHTEYVITDAGPRLMETHNRMAGLGIPEVVRRAYGLDANRLFLGAALGLTEFPTEPPALQGGAALRVFAPPPGTLTALGGLDELTRMGAVVRRVPPGTRAFGFPGLFEELAEAEIGVLLPLNPGDPVVPIRTGWDIRMGMVIASGADASQAIERCEQVLDTVEWHTA
ncbi:ATP-grasp domain-containing protein [Actinoplanes sp. NPDC051859]|uniref:ATP-grasp domain-containing protein n=1 Tax=Actinoplanes sp. NPDC051859 TaxID=3363909 RepID=UPI0037998A2B